MVGRRAAGCYRNSHLGAQNRGCAGSAYPTARPPGTGAPRSLAGAWTHLHHCPLMYPGPAPLESLMSLLLLHPLSGCPEVTAVAAATATADAVVVAAAARVLVCHDNFKKQLGLSTLGQ